MDSSVGREESSAWAERGGIESVVREFGNAERRSRE